MTAELEVDQERRIVLPDELLEKLHVQANTRLTYESEGSYILIQTRPPGLYWENGVPVYDHGRPLPPDHVNWLDEAREDRTRYLMGEETAL